MSDRVGIAVTVALTAIFGLILLRFPFRRLIPVYQPHSSLHYLVGLEYWQHNAHLLRVHVWFGMLIWSIPFRSKYYGSKTP